ncbi:hypothetical protein BLA50215_01229 [Burkholderia lata]|nr:hypothetical protein BLA50215_01229 [Burkholderia lata]
MRPYAPPALLPEQHWPRRRALHRDRDHAHQRRDRKQRQTRENAIEHGFARERPNRQRRRHEIERTAANRPARMQRRHACQIRHEPDVHEIRVECPDDRADAIGCRQRQHDPDFTNLRAAHAFDECAEIAMDFRAARAACRCVFGEVENRGDGKRFRHVAASQRQTTFAIPDERNRLAPCVPRRSANAEPPPQCLRRDQRDRRQRKPVEHPAELRVGLPVERRDGNRTDAHDHRHAGRCQPHATPRQAAFRIAIQPHQRKQDQRTRDRDGDQHGIGSGVRRIAEPAFHRPCGSDKQAGICQPKPGNLPANDGGVTCVVERAHNT